MVKLARPEHYPLGHGLQNLLINNISFIHIDSFIQVKLIIKKNVFFFFFNNLNYIKLIIYLKVFLEIYIKNKINSKLSLHKKNYKKYT